MAKIRKSEFIDDGIVITSKIANNAITDAKIDFSVQRTTNLLTNGGFEKWQKGTSFVNVSDGAYTADRWKITITGGGVHDINDDTITYYSGVSALRHTMSSGIGTIVKIFQPLENYAEIKGKTVSLSMKVRTNKASKVRLYIADLTITYSSVYHSGNSTWELLTLTKTIASGTSGIDVGVEIATDDNTIVTQIDEAMLIIGLNSVDYIPLHPQENLARCQRYLEKGKMSAGSYTEANQWLGNNFSFSVEKPSIPTITITETYSNNMVGSIVVDGDTAKNHISLRKQKNGVNGTGSWGCDWTAEVT